MEIVKDEPFDLDNLPQNKTYLLPQTDLCANGQKYTTGQYTFKIYHLTHKFPAFVRMVAAMGSLNVYEESWNAYPYCRTIITSEYMNKNFYIIIESFSFADSGNVENIHGLAGRDLRQRNVVKIDIANDKVSQADYKPDSDPCKVAAPRAGRPQPLPRDRTGEWMNHVTPVMCCYKLVKVWFRWWGVQTKMETWILTQEQRLFTTYHRQLVCWQDRYTGLTMADVREVEARTRELLARQRHEGALRGFSAADD